MQQTESSDSFSQPRHLAPGPSLPTSSLQTQPQPTNDFGWELLNFMAGTLCRRFDLNAQLFHKIASLQLSDSYLRQMMALSVMEYFRRQISNNVGIAQIEKNVKDILVGFVLRSEKQLEGIEEHEVAQQNQRIYTIKYTDKAYNILQGKEYFNDYLHLFTTIKLLAKQTKTVSQALQELLSKIEHTQPPDHASIHYKLDLQNLDISIDKLILQMLPEVADNIQQIYSTIEQQVWSSSDSSQFTLTRVFKRQLRKAIQCALSSRKQSKCPLMFTIDNLIEVDLFFANQKIIVNAIKLIQEECLANDYEIVKVQGCLQTKQQGSGISMRIRIQRVCCKLNFHLNSWFKEIRFRQLSSRIRSCQLGCTIHSLFEINRIQKDSLSLHLRQLLALNQESINSDSLISVHKLLEHLQVKEYNENIDCLSNSSLSQYRRRREFEKYKTQIIRLQPLGLFQSWKQAWSKGYSQSKTPRSSLESQRVFPQNLPGKDRLAQKKELYKKQKARFRTQNDENQQQPTCISSVHPRFEADLLEQVAHSGKHKLKTICKSIDIVVEGLKPAEPEPLNSQTTQGECQSNLLRERVYELEESLKVAESECGTLKERVRNLELELKAAQAAKQECFEAISSQKIEKQQLKKQLLTLEQQNSTSRLEIEALSKLIQELNVENQRTISERQRLLVDRIEKTQYIHLQESKALLQHEMDYLNRLVQEMKLSEFDLRAQIQRLLVAQEQARKCLMLQQQTSQALQRELQLLKSSIVHQTSNSVIIEKLSTIEQDLKYIRQNDFRIAETPPETLVPATKLKEEPNSQLVSLRVWKNEQCSFHLVAKAERRQVQKSSGQEKRQVCQKCEYYRDKVWQSRKKVYYTSLIFIILLFEAVTFSVSTRIIQ